MHRTTGRFWKYFDALPGPIQNLARQNFELVKSNPGHPSLHLKKVGKFGRSELEATIGHLLFKMAPISFGFGSAPTMNMSA